MTNQLKGKIVETESLRVSVDPVAIGDAREDAAIQLSQKDQALQMKKQ